MIVKFDSLNRLEVPSFTICNPGSYINNGVLTGVVGRIPCTSDEEFVYNFNSESQLNLRVYKVGHDDADINAYMHRVYNAIENRRLIFVEDVGYFVITNVTYGLENGVRFKDVSAESCESELKNKELPYIEDNTYKFGDLMDLLMAVMPKWSIGEVDQSVSDRYRTFEDVNDGTNMLAFLLEKVQDAYECIVLFDIVNRRIHVKDQNSYVVETNIHLTEDDLIKSLRVEEGSDDLYTAIRVSGDGDDVGISAINPLGTNTIYNFSHYLSWMSSGLRAKVESWESLINSYFSEYYSNNLQYYNLLTSRSDKESEIARINIQLDMYRRCRENIVAQNSTDDVEGYNQIIENNGGTKITIGELISETLANIDNLISSAEAAKAAAQNDLASYNAQMSVLESRNDEIHNMLAIESYFTQEEYDELFDYIYEGTYSDEYITFTDMMSYSDKFAQMKILYDRAKDQLKRISQPTKQFSIDMENFLFVKKFKPWSDQIETGCLINAEIDEGDVAPLFLSSITVNYGDRNLSMVFGSRYVKFDTKSLYNDVLGNISRTANAVNYLKNSVSPIKSQFDAMKEALATSRNLTKDAALSSTGESVLIDDTGYTGRKILDDGTVDDHQVKLISKNLVFTDDGWKTAKVALGEIILGDGDVVYGINAEAIIGDIIIGRELHIKDSNGNDFFDIVDGRITVAFREYQNTLDEAIDLSKSLTVMSVTSSNGILWHNEDISTTLTAHVWRGGSELSAAEIAEIGTINWYADGSQTAAGSGASINVSATSKVTYDARLEDSGDTYAVATITLTKVTDGETGPAGATGEAGESVLMSVQEYLASEYSVVLSDEELEESYEGWTTGVPELSSEQYLWVREHIFYTKDGSTISRSGVTDPYCLTTAIRKAAETDINSIRDRVSKIEIDQNGFSNDYKETKKTLIDNIKGVESALTSISGYVKVGIVDYASDGTVIEGIAIGQKLETTIDSATGKTVIEKKNFRSIYTANRLSFWEDGVEVAYVSNHQLYITNVVALAAVTVGEWSISGANASDGLVFKWIGGEE